MADKDDTDTGDNTDDDKSGGEFRAKAEAAFQKVKQLEGENLLYKSGLGHLTERQRNAIIREHGDNEMTTDSLTEIAKEFGWDAPPTPPANSGNGNQAPTNQEQPTTPPADPDEPEVLTPLDVFDMVTRAEQAAQQRVSDIDTVKAMRDAETPDAVKAAIRESGYKHGVVLEEDLM